MRRLASKDRLLVVGNHIRRKVYLDDFLYGDLSNLWLDTMPSGFASERLYVVQTATKVVERCILLASDPGDLVFDPTCGSGTTAFSAERLGRRWITCDTSRVAIAIAKQRLMTAIDVYYQLAHPEEGVRSGFQYEVAEKVTLRTLANNEPPERVNLYNRPLVDTSRMCVTGPFTVEAVPAPVVRFPSQAFAPMYEADSALSRQGPTRSQGDWRAELLKAGIRGKAGQKIEFSRVEPLGGTRWLQADAETKEERPRRVVVSFGPDYAPLEQRQVELAWEETRTLDPRPAIIVFAAFQFDPEAAKDIDELTKERTGMTFLKVQMNTDLFTGDLKKKRSSNESFWLIGQPDVEVRRIEEGDQIGKLQVEVLGFDYYDPKTGTIESGGPEKIAMWMLDPDYDGRSLFPRQVFFSMVSENWGWNHLALTLKAEIDEDLIEAYHGTLSLPFAPGKHKRIAVKIVDDRGIESLRIMDVE